VTCIEEERVTEFISVDNKKFYEIIETFNLFCLFF